MVHSELVYTLPIEILNLLSLFGFFVVWIKRMLVMRIDELGLLTLSPISVASPAESISRSCRKAHASSTLS